MDSTKAKDVAEDGSSASQTGNGRTTGSSTTNGNQTWKAADYASNGRFVADMAGAVVDLLAVEPGERVLDLGCGDGALTERLAAAGAHVLGVDADTSMVAAAQARGLDVRHMRAEQLAGSRDLAGSFDAVFSNAALHWIPREQQATALAGVHAVLRPGGRFVAEMGGLGNIASIRVAVSAVLDEIGVNAETMAASYYPAPADYERMLTEVGFKVETIGLHPRPTPLPHAADGMRRWLETFRVGVLDCVGAEMSADARAAARAEVVARVAALLQPVLTDDAGAWTADYVRLRFRAVRL
jgi:trans-aconitate methyltransferase